LVFSADNEDNALQLAHNLANHHDSYAVLVRDERDDAVAFRIGRALQGFEPLVRRITIDNALTVTDETELRLTPLPQDKVEELMRLNFPEVEASRRFQYRQLAGEFLSFAVSLCQNEALIQEQGHYGQPLRTCRTTLRLVRTGQPDPAFCRLSEGDHPPEARYNCFGTGREQKFNLL
jgi:hypothetical protein